MWEVEGRVLMAGCPSLEMGRVSHPNRKDQE